VKIPRQIPPVNSVVCVDFASAPSVADVMKRVISSLRSSTGLGRCAGAIS
jgi:hypothetical protein